MNILKPQIVFSDMKSITRNIGLSWISQVLYISTQLLRVQLLYRIFEEGARGTWFLMASIVSFTAFLELGMSGAFTRFYARCFGLGEAENQSTSKEKGFPYFSFNTLVGNARIVFLFLGIIAFVLSFFGGLFYLHTVGTFRLFSGGIILAWALLSLGQAITMISFQYSSVLQGKHYVGLDALVRTFGSILSILFLLPILLFRSSLVYVASLEVLRGIATFYLLRYYCKKYIPDYFSVSASWQMKTFTTLLKSSLIPFLAGIAAALVSNTDSFYIASLIDVKKVPDYYNACQFVAQLFGFCITLTASSFPSLLTLFGSGNISAFRELYKKILKHSILLYSVLGFYLLFSGKYILELWLGKNHFVGYPILASLFIFFFLELQNSIFNNAQFSVEKYPLLWSYGSSALLRYLFTFSLVARFGLLGIILGKIISQMLTTDWYSAYFCLKTVKAWPLNFLKIKNGLKLYWPLPLFFTIGYFTRVSLAGPLVSLSAQTTIYFIVSSFVLYFLTDKQTRGKFTIQFRRLLTFVPQQ